MQTDRRFATAELSAGLEFVGSKVDPAWRAEIDFACPLTSAGLLVALLGVGWVR